MVDLFLAGGVVMWPLLGFSLLALALILERLLFWARINRQQVALLRRVLHTYATDVPTTIRLLKQSVHLPTARIFLEALELDGATLQGTTPQQFSRALDSATQAELPKLRRFNTVFETIIALSPLLGLLGTVLGLITSFASISLGDGGGNAGAVTGGISEALVSTATGLVVAIFVLTFANAFRGLYKRQTALIQEYGGQLEILHEMHCSKQLLSSSQSSAPVQTTSPVASKTGVGHANS